MDKEEKYVVKDGAKECSVCKNTKDMKEFGRDRNRPTGISYFCFDCARKISKETRERYRGMETKKRSTENHNKKAYARLVVGRLIKRGILKKEPCFLCGTIRTEGHHLSYDFPKKVIWGCVVHHSNIHHSI